MTQRKQCVFNMSLTNRWWLGQALKLSKKKRKTCICYIKETYDCYGCDTLFYKGDEEGQEEKEKQN